LSSGTPNDCPRSPGAWCGRCGTQHAADVACPAFSLTGPEKPRWRVAVETAEGMRGYGVLVATANGRWRARIVTFPNILWMVPGGGDTLKFFGRTEDETVRQAVDFVRRHCLQKGHLMRDEVEFLAPARRPPAPAPQGPVHAPRPAGSVIAVGGSDSTAPRYTRRLPVRFGRDRPSLLGYTGNLSETGLFLATAKAVAQGALLGLSLELEHCKVPLRGSVAWSRLEEEPGRDLGMGLRLYNPPLIYCQYVRALA
jgi:hypothetical protein